MTAPTPDTNGIEINVKTSTDESGEFTFKAIFCHNNTQVFKVLNRGTHYVDYLKKRRIQMKNWIGFKK
jgi:hypothetical protein